MKENVSSYEEDFFSKIHDKFGIPLEDLRTLWNTTVPKPLVTSSKKKKKTLPSNAWQSFCQEERPRLKDRGLNFGEIAKELGKKWSSMSDDEKASYKKKIPISLKEDLEKEDETTEKPTSQEEDDNKREPIPSDFQTDREKELWKMFRSFKMAQLRDHCQRMGLETSTHRRPMIMALVLHRLTQYPS